jgi:hypothetical protein
MIEDFFKQRYPKIKYVIKPLRQAEDEDDLFTYLKREIKEEIEENEEPIVYVGENEQWMLEFMNFYKSKVVFVKSGLKSEEEIREKMTDLKYESRLSNMHYRSGWAAAVANKPPTLFPRVLVLLKNTHESYYLFSKTKKPGSYKNINFFLRTKDMSAESAIHDVLPSFVENNKIKLNYSHSLMADDFYTINTVDKSIFLVYVVESPVFPKTNSSYYLDYLVCTEYNIDIVKDKVDPLHYEILKTHFKNIKQNKAVKSTYVLGSENKNLMYTNDNY